MNEAVAAAESFHELGGLAHPQEMGAERRAAVRLVRKAPVEK